VSGKVGMQMDDIRKLIKLLEESDLQEIEITRFWGLGRVRLTKHGRSSPGAALPRQNGAGENGLEVHQSHASHGVPQTASPAAGPMPIPGVASPAPNLPGGASQVETRYVAIKSPMVGTFYRAPAPDADPYVEVGQAVEVGQTVCVIEAMKLMNEIESDVRGRIVQVLIDNNHPVEYGQTLFLVDPA
jgi:acetyl-CoA carboxylase biotin carboxyl carrier protein